MKKVSLIMGAIILLTLMSACELDKVKFGEVRMMYGTNEAGRIAYDISTFTGIERGEFEGESGQEVTFRYSVDLEKGSLEIEWQDPSGEVIWRKSHEISSSGDGEFLVNSSGIYQLLIKGVGAGGRFDVSWQAK